MCSVQSEKPVETKCIETNVIVETRKTYRYCDRKIDCLKTKE